MPCSRMAVGFPPRFIEWASFSIDLLYFQRNSARFLSCMSLLSSPKAGNGLIGTGVYQENRHLEFCGLILFVVVNVGMATALKRRWRRSLMASMSRWRRCRRPEGVGTTSELW